MRNLPFISVIILLVMGLSFNSMAQVSDEVEILQVSGQIFTDDPLTGSPVPLPWVNIAIKGTPRGTTSDLNGFFSLVAQVGETMVFSSIAYKTVEFVIPDSLAKNRYSIIQIMARDTLTLPETLVYPWPSREHFKLEFLAMDVTTPIQRQVEESLSEARLRQLQKSVPSDGNESADLYFRQQQQEIYSAGQYKPMNILNPLAWKKFVDAWKDGKFKKQEDD